MKTDRKIKAVKSPPSVKTARGNGRTARKSTGEQPLVAYEHIPVGIVEVSLQGKYMDVNEEFCRILGYSRRELLRRGIKDCTHEEDYAIDLRLYEQLVSGKIPFYRLEKRFVRKGGGIIWVELTRSLVCDEKGNPLYTVGVVLDISDRKDVEKVLRESVERLRLATGAAQMFMWEWDFQSQSYIIADNFEQVLGFSGGLLPKNKFETLWALSPREDVERISQEFEIAVQHQSDLRALSYRVINPENGRIIWLEISAKIVYDLDGNPERMFGVAQNITESKSIQNEIAVISRVPEEDPNPVMRVTPEGKILYANPASAKLLEDWMQGLQLALPEELHKTIADVYTSGRKIESEFEHHGMHFSFTVVPLVDAGYVNLYGKDITERIQAERALRSSEERMRLAIEASRMVAWEWDPATDRVTTSENIAEVYGMSAVDGAAAAFSLIWPADLPAHQEKVERVTRDGGEYYSEFRVTRPLDGGVIWMEERATALTDAAGQVTRLVGIVTDITARKQMETALRESEERFRAMVSQTTAGIAESDLDSSLMFVNPGLSQMLGYSEEELLGRTIWELTYTEDLEENTRLFKRMLEQGESYQFEKRFIRKDGSALWTSVSVTTINDLTGKPKGGVGVVLDIDKRKQAEADLAEYARQQEALYNLSDHLYRATSLQEVYNAALEAIIDALHCNRASILLFDESDVMRFVAWRGLSDPYRQKTEGHSPWKPDAKDPKPISMDDIRTADLDESLRFVIQGEGIGSLAFIPLVSNEKLIGKFMVYFDAPHVFESEELDLSLTIARQLATGIDRKRAEEELRQSEDRFRQAANASGALVYEVDLVSGSSAIVHGLERLVGYDPREVDASSEWWHSLIHPDDLPAHLAQLEQLLKRGGTDVSEYGVRHKNGEWIVVQDNRLVITSAAGQPLRLVGAAIDITERKRAEETLARERALLERLFEIMPVSVSIYDPATNSMRLNAEFERLLGWKSEEVTILSLLESLYPDPEYRNEVLQRMAVADKNEWVEVRVQTRDGRLLDTLWSNISIVEDQKLVTGIALGIDITERKQTEKRLALMAEISEMLRNFDDPYELMYAISKAVGEYLHVKRALFNEIDLEHDREIVHRDYHNGLDSVAGIHKITDYSSITSAEVAAGRTVVNYDSKTDPRTAQEYEKTYALSGERAYVVVPMMRDNRWVASLWVSDDEPRQWSSEDVSLLETVAERTWAIVEKLRIDTALRESEQRFREIFETAGVSVWVEDFSEVKRAIEGLRRQGIQDLRAYFREHPDFVEKAVRLVRILDVNTETLELFRARSKEDLLGSLSNVFAPETEQIFAEELVALAEGREMLRAETQIRTLDGTPISVLFTVHFAPPAGDQSRVVVTLTDITDRKHAEEALRRNEQMFSTLVDAAPFGVYFIDSEFRLRAINKGSEAVFRGIDPLIGRDFAEILRIVWQEPFATEAIERFRHTLRTGESFISPTVVEERANIEEIEAYDWQIHRIVLDDGNYGVVCYFYDLSDQKRLEATVRASESLYRTIARSIPGGGVYVVDKDFRYLVADGPVTNAFGLSREMLEGHTVTEVFPGERGARLEGRLRQNFAGETLSYETEHQGRVYWTQQAPLLDSLGQAIIVTLDITERKQAEEALRQSEERFVRFMRHLPGLAWIKDMQGRYVYANAAAEHAFNTPREELYGRTDEDIFPPEVAVHFRGNDEQALTDEKGVQVIETLQHPDGVLHYSLVSKFPIPGPDGSTILIGGTAFDITERLKAEEALRESEERLRAILRQATAGIVRKDAEGRLLFVNQAFCNMLGYTESDLMGKMVWEFMHPDDIAENKSSYDRLMLEGIPFKLERRLLRQDGSVIWVDASVSPITDVSGRPQSAVAVEVDITARKQAEEDLQQLNLQLEDRIMTRTAKLRTVNQALRDEITERQKAEEALRRSEADARANEEKLSTLFKLLPVGISFLDPGGKIIQTNPALTNILKLSMEQLTSEAVHHSRKYIRANGAVMSPGEFASRRVITEGKTVYNVETGVVLEDGEVIWTSVSAAPVNVADVGAVVVTADITESKRAEKALQESRERLQILSQRLVEVQEEERRAIARELHDRVGQTLAALNINLIIISGQLGGKVDEQVSTRLGDSMKLVAETIALVRDVMSNLRPSVLDDYGLEAAIDSHLSQYMSRYEIGVKFEKPGQPLARLGSSIEMTFLRITQEALMNIARHAQATQVHLRLWYEDRNVWMTIQDNGAGIASWESANRPGSHGLTIMRERAEAVGGSLKVSSVPGKGTKIEVKIPVETSDPSPTKKEVSP